MCRQETDRYSAAASRLMSALDGRRIAGSGHMAQPPQCRVPGADGQRLSAPSPVAMDRYSAPPFGVPQMAYAGQSTPDAANARSSTSGARLSNSDAASSTTRCEYVRVIIASVSWPTIWARQDRIAALAQPVRDERVPEQVWVHALRDVRLDREVADQLVDP